MQWRVCGTPPIMHIPSRYAIYQRETDGMKCQAGDIMPFVQLMESNALSVVPIRRTGIAASVKSYG